MDDLNDPKYIKNLTDLEHIRLRPGMYIGDTTHRGLHHLIDELLDNSIDQFLANQATMIRCEIDGSLLEFVDDGPGLPFDVPNERAQSLATLYLTECRRKDPTADGHTPHVHLGGWGCGLRVVSALTATCEVTTWRKGDVWRQSFTKGEADGPAKVIGNTDGRGTFFRLTIDREIFEADWCPHRLDERFKMAAYLFPGLRVETPSLCFCADRGLADLAVKRATEAKAVDPNRVWWFKDSIGDIHIQAALAGQTVSDTQWKGFANGSTEIDCGTHLTALKRAVSASKLKPAVALIHVVMQNPQFAGPTRATLDAPEILSPIDHALRPSLKRFSERSDTDA